MTKQFWILVTIATLTAAIAAQAPALKIVVIEGENGVNVIQRKTAVRAVVEVRDRNGLPVPGATVTFALTGQGSATIAGGASTLTVTTNAAGQAALTGVTPASAGSLQISVNASYQGLNASAVTISQSVVATLAAAAGIGAVAATTGATAGSGGLSTAAIVGIVGGVGAIGGGVAVLGGGGDNHNDNGSSSGPGTGTGPGSGTNTMSCTFTFSPAELLVPVSGGTFPFTISVSPPNCSNPEWSVDTNLASAFVTANPVRGTGTGSFTLTFAPFTPTPTFPSRSGAVGVTGGFIQFFQPTRF